MAYWDSTKRIGILTAFYIACQIIADITAVKLVEVFGMVIPAGTFVYAATFTLRDAIHRKAGKDYTLAVVIAAGVINILMAAYFMFTTGLPAPVYWGAQEAYATVLSVVPYIVAASIAAEVVSEILDTELYHKAASTFAQNHLWLRVVFSNLFSVPLDSLIFAGLAFVVFPLLMGQEALPGSALATMIISQSLFKWVVTAIVLPTIYWGKEDVYDK